MATHKQGKYEESSIRVLKGLEPVRQRPGMYTRTDNPLHCIQEVIDNAADEALAGFGKRLALTMHSDGSVSNVRVLRGVDDRLDGYAMAALSRWRFHPATKNGNPVALEAVVMIPFKAFKKF